MTNGLNAIEQKKLTQKLAQLEAVVPRRCLLGGGESRDLMSLIDQLKGRLNPVSASDLDERAQQFIENYSDFFAAAARADAA
jgi:hypothetical protein